MVLSALLFLIPSSADNPQKKERDQDEQKLFREEKLYSQHCPVLLPYFLLEKARQRKPAVDENLKYI